MENKQIKSNGHEFTVEVVKISSDSFAQYFFRWLPLINANEKLLRSKKKRRWPWPEYNIKIFIDIFGCALHKIVHKQCYNVALYNNPATHFIATVWHWTAN